MQYSQIQKLASAIKNDILGGLRGYHTNISISEEQLEDEIVETRLQVLKEYSLKGVLPSKDLYVSINCIDVDCKALEKCQCRESNYNTKIAYFEVPQILNDYGSLAIEYIGSPDKQLPFVYYTSLASYRNHKYRKRGKNKPYVYIDTTPNENNMYDCYVFNAPLLKQVSITAIFKDERQLQNYNCCYNNNNISFIDNEVKNRLVAAKLKFYRQFQPILKPNTQEYE